MKTRAFTYCAVGALFITIIFFLLNDLRPARKFYHPLLHSSVEQLGGGIALNLFLLLFFSAKKRGRKYLVLIQSAFVSMGTISLAQAFIGYRQSFIWLHGSATFAGGFFFALVWLPDKILKTSVSNMLPLYVFSLYLVFSIASFFYPDVMFSMLVEERFASYPSLMNFLGAILFLAAAVRFGGYYLSYRRRFDDLFFALLSLILGIASLVFNFGYTWTWQWWTWHGIRLIAFLAALLFLLHRFSLPLVVAQESVDRKGSLLDNLPDLFYIFCDRRGALYYSSKVKEILGYSPDELLANPFGWYDAIHPDDRPTVDAALKAFKESGTYHIEYRIKDRAGRWHWFLDRFVRQRFRDGDTIVEGLATDITAQKEVEEALRQEKDFTDKLINTLRDIVFVFDPVSGSPIRWNDNFVRVSGYSRIEIAAMKAPDDFLEKADLEKARHTITVVLESGQGSLELNLATRDGAQIPFEFMVNTVAFEDRTFLLSLGRDLTERKQAELELRRSEERFRSSLDQMLEGCQIIGPDWRYLYINEAGARHGRRPKETYIGRTMMELYPGIDRTEVFGVLREVMAGGAPRHLENEFTYPDGTSKWHELSIQPVKWLGLGIQPTVNGVFVLSIDISERKQAEKELQQYAETQAVLLREVNHRVKNNLTILIGMLRKEYDKAAQKGVGDYPPVLEDLISRLLGLGAVHSLLSASNWQPILLSRLCRTMVMEGVKGRYRTVQYDISPSTVTVESNQAHHLAMVLNELVTNSIKYAAVGEKALELSIAIQGIGKDIVLIYRDNGPGYCDTILAGELRSAGIGFDLITGIIKKSLRGGVSFRNENGAVAEIIFPKHETSPEVPV